MVRDNLTVHGLLSEIQPKATDKPVLLECTRVSALRAF